MRVPQLNIKRVKLIMVIVATLAAVKLIAPQVFLANTPRVNPLLVSNLLNAPSYMASLIGSFGKKQAPPSRVEVFSQIPQVSPPTGIAFQSVARGVKAAEDKATNTLYFTVDKGTTFKVIETEITKDGVKKKVRLLIPIER